MLNREKEERWPWHRLMGGSPLKMHAHTQTSTQPGIEWSAFCENTETRQQRREWRVGPFMSHANSGKGLSYHSGVSQKDRQLQKKH